MRCFFFSHWSPCDPRPLGDQRPLGDPPGTSVPTGRRVAPQAALAALFWKQKGQGDEMEGQKMYVVWKCFIF